MAPHQPRCSLCTSRQDLTAVTDTAANQLNLCNTCLTLADTVQQERKLSSRSKAITFLVSRLQKHLLGSGVRTFTPVK